MGPVEKTLWYIDSHLEHDITLSDIVPVSGVSRYHLSRVFLTATGYSVMRYVRGRRLSKAAQSLAAGAPDILTVALMTGYGSHEAFTRAFCEQFGVTPEAVRSRGCINTLQLVEPINMTEARFVDLKPPRLENGKAMRIAGLSERYTSATLQGIPSLWQRFNPYIGNLAGQIGDLAYGVCCPSDESQQFEYIAGVEVSNFAGLPSEFRHIQIEPQQYAVFTHEGHVSSIRNTCYTIWNQWLPESDYEQAESLDFERYDERFDPQTGNGIVEIWVPVKAKA